MADRAQVRFGKLFEEIVRLKVMYARLHCHLISQLALQQFIDFSLSKESPVEGEIVERQDPLLNLSRQALERHVSPHLIANLLESNGRPVMRPQVHVSDRDEPNVQNEADEREHDGDHHLSVGRRETREERILCVLHKRLTSTWLVSSMEVANSVSV